MSAQVDAHGTILDGCDGRIWGVYDRDLEDFVAVFESLRDALDRETELEQGAYLEGRHIGGYIHNTWVPRYSIDQMPADHPLAEQVRS